MVNFCVVVTVALPAGPVIPVCDTSVTPSGPIPVTSNVTPALVVPLVQVIFTAAAT